MKMETECMEIMEPMEQSLEMVGEYDEGMPEQAQEAALLLYSQMEGDAFGMPSYAEEGSFAVDVEESRVHPLPEVVDFNVCKLCPDCGVVKPASEFHARKRAALGLAVYCKLCSSARSKARNKKLAEMTLERGRGEAVPAVDRKACACCMVEKSAAEFHVKSRSLTGLESYCRPCHALKMRKYRDKHTRRNREVVELPQGLRKMCSRCGMEKTASEFHRHMAQVSGLGCYCKLCAAERAREKRRKAAEAKGRRFVPSAERRLSSMRARSLEAEDDGGAVQRPQSAQQETKTKRQKQSGEKNLDSNGYKICPDCEVGKPPSEYHLRSKAALGLAVYCKECSAKRSAQRRMRIIAENASMGIPPPKMRARRAVGRAHGPVDAKPCVDCGEVKDAAEFLKHKKNRTGLSSYCKPCYRLRVKRSHEKRRGKEQLSPDTGTPGRTQRGVDGTSLRPAALFSGNMDTMGGEELCPTSLEAREERERLMADVGQALERKLLCLEGEAASVAMYDMEGDACGSIGEGFEGGIKSMADQDNIHGGFGMFGGYQSDELVMLGNLQAVERQMVGRSVNQMELFPHFGFYDLAARGVGGSWGEEQRFGGTLGQG